MNYIQVKNLSKSYSDIDALNDLSMDIDSGILFGILGPNGAGKSTLIKILATLVEPNSGDCLLYTSPSPRDRQKSRMPSSA